MKSHRIRAFLGGNRPAGVQLAAMLFAKLTPETCPVGELRETWPVGSLRDTITNLAIEFVAGGYRYKENARTKGRWHVTMCWTKDHASIEIYIYRNIYSVLT